LHEDGWRQAMVGSISFYDAKGERLHTSCTAQSPEYGKETFTDRLPGKACFIEFINVVFPTPFFPIRILTPLENSIS
jgi:hypothetical protein